MGVVTRRVKWLASVGLVATLGVGVGAGIATSAAARPKPKTVHTSAATAPVTSASFRFSVGVSGVAGLGTIVVKGTGQADLVNDAVSLSATLPASISRLIPGGSATPEVVNAVLSGGTVYVEVPALATLLGAPWISIALPPSATSAIPGVFTEVGGALGNVNEILAFARSHHASVHSAGTSIVDGTSVTGSRIAARVKGLKLAAVLWANSSGQLVEAKVNAAVGGGRHAVGLSAVVDLSGYDAPVTVTAPPSTQVRAIPLSLITGVLGTLFHGVHLGAAGHGHGAKKG